MRFQDVDLYIGEYNACDCEEPCQDMFCNTLELETRVEFFGDIFLKKNIVTLTHPKKDENHYQTLSLLKTFDVRFSASYLPTTDHTLELKHVSLSYFGNDRSFKEYISKLDSGIKHVIQNIGSLEEDDLPYLEWLNRFDKAFQEHLLSEGLVFKDYDHTKDARRYRKFLDYPNHFMRYIDEN